MHTPAIAQIHTLARTNRRRRACSSALLHVCARVKRVCGSIICVTTHFRQCTTFGHTRLGLLRPCLCRVPLEQWERYSLRTPMYYCNTMHKSNQQDTACEWASTRRWGQITRAKAYWTLQISRINNKKSEVLFTDSNLICCFTAFSWHDDDCFYYFQQ